MNNVIWQTHGGRVIAVEDMDNTHIERCINTMVRGWAHAPGGKQRQMPDPYYGFSRSQWIDIFMAELKRRKGDVHSEP